MGNSMFQVGVAGFRKLFVNDPVRNDLEKAGAVHRFIVRYPEVCFTIRHPFQVCAGQHINILLVTFVLKPLHHMLQVISLIGMLRSHSCQHFKLRGG